MLQLYIFLFVLATPAFSHKQRLPSTHKRHYQVAHAYDSDYAFSERDGWQSVPISDLPYKYDVGTQQKLAASDPPVDALLDGSRRRRRSMAPRNCKAQPSPVDLAEASVPQTTSQPPPPPSSSPSPAAVAVQQQPQPHPTPQQLPAKPHTKPVDQPVKEQSKPSKDDEKKGSAISVVVDGALTELDDMHGEGDSEDVTITWYTGNDLKNPSCWPKINWAPSDESFAAAVTLEGWLAKPACFSFLELCNEDNKCIFVRVIDTCAGCKKGSKHVDLTKAAFKQLANLDTGVLKVKMRLATNPLVWYKDLWGPQE